MKEELVFFERQYFKRWLAIVLSLFMCLPLPVIYIVLFVTNKSGGQHLTFHIIFLVAALITVLIAAFMFLMRLDTVINKEGVYYRMFPFHRGYKFKSWEMISEAEVAIISPFGKKKGRGARYKIMNMQGGIHYGLRAKSYMIAGNIALVLTLINNRKIYIGTRRFEEMSEFLKKLHAERKQK